MTVQIIVTLSASSHLHPGIFLWIFSDQENNILHMNLSSFANFHGL